MGGWLTDGGREREGEKGIRVGRRRRGGGSGGGEGGSGGEKEGEQGEEVGIG